MNIVLWIAFAAFILLGGSTVMGARGRVNERALAAHSTRMGLQLPEVLRTPVLRRIGARERSSLWFGFGGMAVGIAAGLAVERLPGWDGVGGVFVILASAAGMTIGGFTATRRERPALVEGAPRVARSTAVRVDDYSRIGERWASRIAAVVIPVTTLCALALTIVAPAPSDPGFVSLVVAGAAGVVAAVGWLLLTLAERSTVDHAQFASSDLELAWDDAERSMTVRQLRELKVMLAFLPATVLLVLAMLGAPFALHAPQGEALRFAAVTIAGLIAAASMIAVIIPSLSGRAERNPSLRLWHGTDLVAA